MNLLTEEMFSMVLNCESFFFCNSKNYLLDVFSRVEELFLTYCWGKGMREKTKVKSVTDLI